MKENFRPALFDFNFTVIILKNVSQNWIEILGFVCIRYHPWIIFLWIYRPTDTRRIPGLQIWWNQGVWIVLIRWFSSYSTHSVCCSIFSRSSHCLACPRGSILGKLFIFLRNNGFLEYLEYSLFLEGRSFPM